MNMKIPAREERQTFSSSRRWWEASCWDATGTSLPLLGHSSSSLLFLQEDLPMLQVSHLAEMCPEWIMSPC